VDHRAHAAEQISSAIKELHIGHATLRMRVLREIEGTSE